MELSEKVAQLIESKKVTRYEIAQQTGISEAALSRIIKGETKNLSINTRKSLADYFAVSEDFFREGDNMTVREALEDNYKPLKPIVIMTPERFDRLIALIEDQQTQIKMLLSKIPDAVKLGESSREQFATG